MLRRIHLAQLDLGDITLPDSQGRHIRDVLRLRAGEVVEAFDSAGSVAVATIMTAGSAGVTIRIEQVAAAAAVEFSWTIASAVPKGPRADWLIEKLSELGCAKFVPLITARSVSTPSGKEKIERWARLAAEAAKQSRRVGVMGIEGLVGVEDFVKGMAPAAVALAAGAPAKSDKTDASIALNSRQNWYFSTDAKAVAVGEVTRRERPRRLTMLVGPEGGWTEGEIKMFEAAGLVGVKLTETVLRTETAGVAAGVVAATW